MWERRIYHEGLKALRVVKGSTEEDVKIKADLQLQAWAKRWERVQLADARRAEREGRVFTREHEKAWANTRTIEARQRMEAVTQILSRGIEANSQLNWDKMKDRSKFPLQKPEKPVEKPIPTRPNIQDSRFQPKLIWVDKLIPPFAEKKRAAASRIFVAAEQAWKAAKADVEKENAASQKGYEAELAGWEQQKAEFLKSQAQQHQKIDELRAAYLGKKLDALDECWELILSGSEYPDEFPKSFTLDYIEETRILIVEYSLPAIHCLPQVKEVKYIATRDEVQEVPVSAAWLNRTYDEVLYQISLRTIYELFQSDEANALESIVFNGWVNSTDRATGQEVNACVLSVQASKPDFMQINLSQVDPRACFKKLKGISGAKLTELNPVRPVLQLNREDRRFVTPYQVADGLDDSSNLAAMDWLDFENLIRELFEKEFSKDGGEVKITRASRDGGVDAIAFDPDPIRGGKIVIQAKRYTNVVSVSAVRDLYGTVMNEGATKGILVTTADYGPDAYEFAKDKPLTLLSGSELLYLLQKHGHRAKIDLAEARCLAAEAEKEKAKGAVQS